MYSRVVRGAVPYFQILDNKDECVGYYANNSLIFNSDPPSDLKYTWNFHPSLNAEFAQLYINGLTISDLTFPYKRDWERLKTRKSSFIESFKNAHIDLNKHCFYDLVPQSFLEEYNSIKNEATKFVIENYEKPNNYEFLKDLSCLVYKIRNQKLKLNQRDVVFLKIKNKVSYNNYVNYNVFGTVTGRLTTTSDSFPILTLNKKDRHIIAPHNKYFLELDINAADVRSFLALLGKEQPNLDIHDWNIAHIFKNKNMSRQEAKTKFFSWFYNPNNVDLELQNLYDRDYLLQRYFDGKTIKSPFGRTIISDPYHALSYLIQGASNDIILRNIIKLDKLLEKTNSFVSFMIHDSVIIDFDPADASLLDSIYNTFTDTEYGPLLASVHMGTNFGNMELVK